MHYPYRPSILLLKSFLEMLITNFPPSPGLPVSSPHLPPLLYFPSSPPPIPSCQVLSPFPPSPPQLSVVSDTARMYSCPLFQPPSPRAFAYTFFSRSVSENFLSTLPLTLPCTYPCSFFTRHPTLNFFSLSTFRFKLLDFLKQKC